MKPGEQFKIFQVNDGTYYLQVRSIDDLGLEGLPSDTATVKVRINPMPPIIESPANGAVSGKNLLMFRWLRVGDAARYHVQIAEDKGFSRLVEDPSDIRDTEYKPAHLEFKTYYFRISSIAKDNYQGEWSDVFSFTIAPGSPAPAEIQRQ